MSRKKKQKKLNTGIMYRDKTNVECGMYHTGKITATGLVTKGLEKNLEAVRGKRSIDSLQKTAVLTCTSHIIRKVLQCET